MDFLWILGVAASMFQIGRFTGTKVVGALRRSAAFPRFVIGTPKTIAKVLDDS